MARENGMPAGGRTGEQNNPTGEAAVILQEEEFARLQEELVQLRSALEDILVLAHASGEASKRITKMERRALAALSGKPHLGS